MISSAYNYYLSTYGRQQVSKYDSHKRSELRSVYNNMLKVNRKTPLYKILDAENVQKYAIDLKESARALKNVASSLTDENGSISGFLKKKAVSSNTAIVEAEYIGGDDDANALEQLNVLVHSLAASQINEGKYLNPSQSALSKGSYFFDMNIGEYTYEFSFGVGENEDNESIQNKIIRLFNRAGIGVTAKRVADEAGNGAVVLESMSTGNGGSRIFTLLNNEKSDGDVIQALGIGNVKQEPSEAEFSIDGVEHRAPENTFTVQHRYKFTIHNISHGDESVKVGIKEDIDSILENVEELIESYNHMVDLAVKNSERDAATGDDKLMRDLNSVASYYKSSLEPAGFKVSDDGHVTVDEALLIQSAREGSLNESLEKLNSFKKAVVAKADDISINPMKYVNKKLIAYPNPIKTFNSPYMSSIYSGMMFSGYI